MNSNPSKPGSGPGDPPPDKKTPAGPADPSTPETTPEEDAALDAVLNPKSPLVVPGGERPGGFVGVLMAFRRILELVLAGICLVLFVLLVIVVSWQVFTREVLQDTAPWTTEAAQYTFVVLALFAAAYVFGERGHIAVEMFVERFAPAGQKVAAVAIELVVSFFIFSVFILGGSLVAQGLWNQTLSTLPLTVGNIYVVMPIAGVIILYFSFTRIIAVLTGTEEAFPAIEDMGEAI
ncbi:MAG TPA: TRAP transporter small permease [Actinomycetaceae bacterium]|nr:TRAP transporter small permease [Actinomycetaceae bacterium]